MTPFESSLRVPGIQNIHAKPGEVLHIASDDRQLIFEGCCRDHAVRRIERRAFHLPLSIEPAPAVHDGLHLQTKCEGLLILDQTGFRVIVPLHPGNDLAGDAHPHVL